MTHINDMPGHLIRRLHQAAVAIFHSQMAGLGHELTPVQYAALAKIETRPGIDQVTLAGLIAYDRTTIAGVVDRLVQKGWVLREVSDQDRRARVLKITDEGLQVLSAATPYVESAQAVMLQGLEDSEAKEFLRLLRKATAAVNDLSRAPLKDTRGH